jgi:hypothetical protein
MQYFVPMSGSSTPRLQRIGAKTQKRLDYLMARSNEDELTGDERTELEKYAIELEALSIKNAKLLAKHAVLSGAKVRPAMVRRR